MARPFCTLLRSPGAVALWLLGAWGCAARPRLEVALPNPPHSDTMPIAEPGTRFVSEAYDLVENNFFDPLANLLDVPEHLGRARGRPREAANLNAWDDVEDSAWFEHRNGVRPMTPEEIVRGPNTGTGPDTSAPWTIVSGGAAGITPKFTIRDVRGNRYIIKFDPPDYPELASGAEMISTKLFYAAGYHTPENTLVFFDPAGLAIDPKVTVVERGLVRPMTQEDVRSLLRRVGRGPDGRVRALASKFLEGRPKGPWDYEGRRADDPNDRYEHQHRRELRGLYVLAAWLNHEDARQGNTLDMYVGEPGKGYLRHYLIDFGSTLGSGATVPHSRVDGSEYFFDLGNIMRRAITLGLYRASWEPVADRPVHPSIGHFTAEGFDPAGWKPTYPNPAFAQRTARDAYWGTKLVASFTDEEIRAAVRAAGYSDPAAEDLMLAALLARRDRILRHGFHIVTPIESPEVTYDSAGTLILRFEDLAVRYGLVAREQRSYTARLKHAAMVIERSTTGRVEADGRGTVRFEGVKLTRPLPAEARGRVATLEIVALDGEGRGRSTPPANVYLLLDPATRRYRVAGLAH
ncbi:MAG: hypothetical protein HY702_00730 [Gemmatimonadetes bacterium]|nr:hypothetical protein [Gemmatimonadota bacterium]